MRMYPKCLLALSLFFCMAVVQAQENAYRKAVEFESNGAIFSAREAYKKSLKDDSRVEETKVYLKLAGLELKAGNRSRAVSYWKRVIKADSTSAHAVCAFVNLASTYAVMANEKRDEVRPEKGPRKYNDMDSLELKAIRSAVLNYKNLVYGDEYFGFPFSRYLIYYRDSTRNFDEVEFQFKSMSRMASDKGHEWDDLTWQWCRLVLETTSFTGKLYSYYSPSRVSRGIISSEESQFTIGLDDINSGFRELLERSAETQGPDFISGMKMVYAGFLTEWNKALYKWVNFHGSRLGDSIEVDQQFQTHLSQLLNLDQQILNEYQASLKLCFPDFNESGFYSNPSTRNFNESMSIYSGRKVLAGKAGFLQELNWRYYGSFDWPWEKHFNLLGFKGRKTGATADFMDNPDIFTGEAIKLAMNCMDANEQLVNHVADQLTLDKDKLEWISTAYDEKIMAVDLAFQYFFVTNDNPRGVRSSGSRSTVNSSSSMKIQIDHFISENPIYDAFYYAEKAKATLLMKDLIQKSETSGDFQLVPTINEIQEELDEQTALIEYVITPYNYYQFTITQSYLELKTKRLDEEDILPHVSGIRNGIIFQDDAVLLESSRFLYKKLIPKLDETITNLVFIPDKELSLIPFEVLTSKKVKKKEFGQRSLYPFLLNSYNISYSFSVSLWHFKKTSVPQSLAFQAFAPVFSDNHQIKEEATRSILTENDGLRGLAKDGSYIVPLPGTKTEVEEISQIFQETGLEYSLFTDAKATEKQFKSLEFKMNDILHLASHGLVNVYDPEKSGILFSQQDPEEDGMFYVSEIIGKEIHPYLVTLSACETSVGKVIRGEGVIGISRAFMIAGATNVIASLWQVSDASTSRLMTQFYRYLIVDRLPVSDALKKAKLDLIMDPKYAAPFYWSPFILVGQ